jgi:hypothetical protein
MTEIKMTDKKKVLLIGLDPAVVDFKDFPGLDAAILSAALKADEDRLNGLGYDVQWCLIDPGKTPEAVVLERLGQKQFDCICIGAGVRTSPMHFILFEKLINVLHEHAPRAKLCFNTKPSDTAASVQRWV